MKFSLLALVALVTAAAPAMADMHHGHRHQVCSVHWGPHHHRVRTCHWR